MSTTRQIHKYELNAQMAVDGIRHTFGQQKWRHCVIWDGQRDCQINCFIPRPD